MASFQKRGKTWQYTISHTVNGKRRQVRKGGFSTKKEAATAALEIEKTLKIDGFNLNDKTIFSDYFRRYKEIFKDPFISGSTKKHYNSTLYAIEQYFGTSRAIQDITKADYQEFITHYGSTRAKETVVKLNSHIRACVNNAIDEGIIRIDFTKNVKIKYTVQAKSDDDKFMEVDEAKKLIKACYENLNKSNAYYMILLGICGGLRFSEIVGLTVDDLDFKNNTISINKTWQYLKRTGAQFAPTKNESSKRVIAMDKKIMGVFKKFIIKSVPNEYGLIFFSPASKYLVLSNSDVNKILKSTCKELCIQEITMHALRHTHASILLAKNVSMYYVSERLGHADINTTLRVYAHILKDRRKVDEALTINVFEDIN